MTLEGEERRGAKGRWKGPYLQRRGVKGRRRCTKGDEPMLKCNMGTLKDDS